MPLEGAKDEVVDQKQEKKEQLDKSKTDFSKTFDKEQDKLVDLHKKEAESKKSEGDPDKNLDTALSYPTEKEVGNRLMETFDSVKNIQDSKVKSVLMKMLKNANDSLSSGDLDTSRKTLSFVNDKIQEINVNTDKPINEVKKEEMKTKQEEPKATVESDDAFYKAQGEGKSPDMATAKKIALMNVKNGIVKQSGNSFIENLQIEKESVVKNGDLYTVSLVGKMSKISS